MSEFRHGRERLRRLVAALLVACLIAVGSAIATDKQDSPTPAKQGDAQTTQKETPPKVQGANTENAAAALASLAVKGRAPMTGYAREQFGAGWAEVDKCDMRQFILRRDVTSTVLDKDKCTVLSGTLNDPYTGKVIAFKRGAGTSSKVQIDHVVALGDAWQTGAQQLDVGTRAQLANDPLELLAVDGSANEQKSDGDAATWLPPNKDYRCRYVARQVAIKQKYHLWVTRAEHDTMSNILASCPSQVLPIVD